MRRIANSFIEWLIKQKIIKDCDRELYVYGFWQGEVFLINLLTVVIIGLLTNMLWESVTFMIFYGTIRPFAGGYHARTQKTCYIFSILLLFMVLAALYWCPWNSTLCLFTTLASSIIIFHLAPVEDENKPLDKIENHVYKLRSRKVCCLLAVVICISLVFRNINFASCVTISLFATSIMLVLGKIKLSKKGRTN